MDIGYITRNMTRDPRDSKKTAIKVESGGSWSYQELHERSNAYANKLYEWGVRKGDRVGILLYNSKEYIGLYFAVAKIGAIAVRLNFRLSSNELEYALNDSETKVLCFDSDFKEKIEAIHDQISVQEYFCLSYHTQRIPNWSQKWQVLNDGSVREIHDQYINLTDPVMLMYTSGTTGRPKGAIWTHDTTLWFSSIQAMKWGFTGNEIGMTTGPLYHVGALEDIALPILMVGGTLVITQSKGFEISRVLSVIEEEKVTDCFMFPFMIYEMLQLSNFNQYELKNLRTIYTGGDSLMPWAFEQLNKHHPHLGVVQVYGLTEGQPIATSLDSNDSLSKGHTVGKPMPLTEVTIIDNDENHLPIGKVGEIAIKSPGVSAGYWKKLDATNETFTDGWCKTGDLGMIDEDGYISIAGRKKDMIRSGGENIYAAEIEDVLYRHSSVKEASIIGIPDPKFIEAVCAVIVTKETVNTTEEEIIDHCKEYLASYKKPKRVIFVDELPRTASGKIQKYVLRKQFGDNSVSSK
ncbi:AMP-binding protein [Virgibacillus sp. NKC19-3]|uniref:AMP-binding protein n=1 Tax=Virgibacillus saliphilus TaxID=2831674 RepID=UPI001C9B44B0|nr:AMP-binding protein [Virgibacillus sp. NKC19-3]MBY7144295.1 AMP-binding protein [Virgibacillus sp. NKC19-3]